MAKSPAPAPRRVAVDTGALLALASTRDQYHARAVATAARLERAGTRLLGHTLVLGELHGHLIRHLDPGAARQLVTRVLRDPMFEWVDVTAELVDTAITTWLDRYRDQRFSLTDGITFQLMRRERVSHAFAFDQDFVTAGFALL